MKIHSTKTLLFKGDDTQRFKINHHGMEVIPDWVKDTTTFKFAVSDGTITIIDDKQKEINALNGDLKDNIDESTKKTTSRAKK